MSVPGSDEQDASTTLDAEFDDDTRLTGVGLLLSPASQAVVMVAVVTAVIGRPIGTARSVSPGIVASSHSLSLIYVIFGGKKIHEQTNK